MALEQSPTMVIITGLDGLIEWVNPRFTWSTGYTLAEAKGRNPGFLKAGTAPPDFYAELWTTLAQGKVWRGEFHNRKKNGELYWERASISTILGESGAAIGYMAVKEDITEAKADAELLAKIFKASPEAISIATLDGGVYLQANQIFLELFGFSKVDLLGRSVRDIAFWVEPEDRRRFLDELAFKGEVRNFTARVRISSGAVRHMRISSETIEHQGQLCSLNYLLDITDQLQEEEAKVKLQAQLLQSQKMESLGSLAGGIAHDFNNILTAILGAAEMMNLQLDPASPARNPLEIIFQAGRRARELNRQIQTFSRKGREESIPFDLSALIREALRLLVATLPKNVAVEGTVAPSLWVLGDPNQIHQVFMNLTINAFHALENLGGVLTVDLGEVPESGPAGPGNHHVRLAVRDTGCGMEAAVLERIFDPFYTTKAAREGTGLGLAVVQGIIAKHSGTIQVASEVGQGSEFQVFLPATEERPRTFNGEHAAAASGTERILLVDDEDFVTALTKQGLQELGYEVTAKTSSLDALGAFRNSPTSFDVLVTDLAMPNLSGLELVERIQGIRPSLPTILITGEVLGERLPPEGAIAFDEVLVKPQSPADLARAIRRVLESRKLLLAGAAPALPAKPAAPDRPRKILLAEDNPETRALLRQVLARDGYTVQEAVDGQDAWEQYLAAPDPASFSLIMTDIRMPRMDGLELVTRIRQFNPGTPVVTLSALDNPMDLETARTLNVSEVINKPFDPKGLSDCVKFFLHE